MNSCHKDHPTLRFWHLPNLLGIDATLIAVAWYLFYLPKLDNESIYPSIILALSVWLTYQADRLFDIRKVKLCSLTSFRHVFAKKNEKLLWKIWFFVLSFNCVIASQTLSISHLKNGCMLLAITVVYTYLNQKTKKIFFPKELIVALIFTGGIFVFNTPPVGWYPFVSIFLLCYSNCLLIASNEVEQDRIFDRRYKNKFYTNLPLILSVTTLMALTQPPVLLSVVLLNILFLLRRKMHLENYRILVDGSLLVIPIGVLIAKII